MFEKGMHVGNNTLPIENINKSNDKNNWCL